MTPFMTDDFLLDTEFARRLYHDYAKDQPIFDYHCHLPPQQVAENYRFKNLYDIWLKGDHYKWRAMRTNGVAERLCTGDASDREKFDAWAATVPHTIGNPLFHWTHLELRRPFGITGKLLSPATADEIWDQCNELLAQDNFSARGIMKQMNVKMVGTTDDPIDSLEHHAVVAKDTSFDIKVLPSWRPDKAFNIEQATFNDYMAKLAEVSDTDIRRFADLQTALTKRLDHFAAHGCKVSDHALDVVLFADAAKPSWTAFWRVVSRVKRLTSTTWRSLKRRCWCSSVRNTPVAAGYSSTTSARCATTTSVSSNCSVLTWASTPSTIARWRKSYLNC